MKKVIFSVLAIFPILFFSCSLDYGTQNEQQKRILPEMILSDVNFTRIEKFEDTATLQAATLEIFKEDAENKAEYVSEFLRFGFAIGRFDNSPFLDDLHLCNQMYIATVQGNAELTKLHLPYLYLKEIEYFTLVNSYSECLRTINRIMDLGEVPDFCMGAALSQAVDLFMASGLTHEAEKYVEALRVFSNVCDLPARNLIMIDCNLMQAYAYMGKRKEYEY